MIVTQHATASEETDQQTWHYFWSYTASQIIASLSPAAHHDSNGAHGWGLHDPANPQRSLLLHPSNKEKRHLGDLSLTLLGQSTFVLPRDGLSYVAYIRYVTQEVQKTANAFFEHKLR